MCAWHITKPCGKYIVKCSYLVRMNVVFDLKCAVAAYISYLVHFRLLKALLEYQYLSTRTTNVSTKKNCFHQFISMNSTKQLTTQYTDNRTHI